MPKMPGKGNHNYIQAVWCDVCRKDRVVSPADQELLDNSLPARCCGRPTWHHISPDVVWPPVIKGLETYKPDRKGKLKRDG